MNQVEDVERNLSEDFDDINDDVNDVLLKEDVFTFSKQYEPQFLEVYQEYSDYVQSSNFPHSLTICNIFGSCLEHLVLFSSWVRKDAATVSRIQTVLQNNSILRPELRNGLVHLLIYVFAAAFVKQLNSPNEDVFSVIMNEDYGLGIVNKSALQIYNDRYGYFNFLKNSLSGLIKSGVIPDNERLNQPKAKKAKKAIYDEAEVSAFEEIKTILLRLVNQRNVIAVRNIVDAILMHWQNKIYVKQFKSSRFQTALGVIEQVGFSPELPCIPRTIQSVAHTMEEHPGSDSAVIAFFEDMGSIDDMASGLFGELHEGGDRKKMRFDSFEHVDAVNPLIFDCPPPTLTVDATQFASSPKKQKGVEAFCFERIASVEWKCSRIIVYDISIFLNSCISEKVFIVEKANSPLFAEGFSPTDSNGVKGAGVKILTAECRPAEIIDLEGELIQRNCLLSTWRQADYPQLRLLVDNFVSYGHEAGLCHTAFTSTTALAYEVTNKVGIMIRSNAKLGIKSDCWRFLFSLRELCKECSVPVWVWLCALFPQLSGEPSRILRDAASNGEVAVVKYSSRAIDSWTEPFLPPDGLDIRCYQTIGASTSTAGDILSIMNPLPGIFHDLVLEINPEIAQKS